VVVVVVSVVVVVVLIVVVVVVEVDSVVEILIGLVVVRTKILKNTH